MSSTTLVHAAPPEGAGPAPDPDLDVLTPRQVWFSVYRHHLRVLRRQATAWILVVAGIGAMLATGYQDAYPTVAERERMAASLEGVPAFEALFGRTVEMATLEGFLLWRWGGFAFVVVAVWGMLSSVKLLRGAEEAGHVEPLRAGVVTPRGLLGAALGALGTVYLVLAVTVAVSYTAAGMDAATAWTFGAVLGLLAAMFAAAGALATQVVATRRHALAVTGVALGGALAVRVLAAGSDMPNWLYALTPFGWASYLHEVDGLRIQVLVAFTVLVAVLLLGALRLGRRDLHASLLESTERLREDAPPVRGLAGLARALTVGPLLAWGSAIVGAGLIFGLLAHDFAAAMADLPDTVEIGEQIGWVGLDTPEGVVASLVGGFLLLFLALFAVAQGAAIREEEASWRIEHLLVRPVGRTRWLASRVVAASIAIVVLAAATMVAATVGSAVTGTGLGVGDTVLATANLVPLSVMFLGLGVALMGIVPRYTAPAAFGLVLVVYIFDLVGGILEIPEPVLELSPFRHVAAVPAADLAVGPAAVMIAVGIAGVVLGAISFRRRDLQEA